MARWFAVPTAVGTRVDTKVSTLVNPVSFIPNLVKIRERRLLRKGERQRIFSSVGAHSVRPCLCLYAVSDSLLLHIRVHLRRRDITVSRNSLTRYTAWHLRIRRLVQFIFAGAFRHNAQKNWAALSCRPLRGANLMCSSTLSVNCEKAEKDMLW